jgi:hypothetical protein
MTVAPWVVGLAVLSGSAAGALIRQLVIRLFSHSHEAMSKSMLATSSVLGGFLGAIMAGVMSNSRLAPEQQGIVLIGLIAALGTFNAGAVVANADAPSQTGSSFFAHSRHSHCSGDFCRRTRSHIDSLNDQPVSA